MLQKQQSLTSQDFNKGLVTRSDIIRNDPNQSPNTMDVKWNFDSSIQKRLGTSTTNSVTLVNAVFATSGWTLDAATSLTTNLEAYWKLDEASGSRADQVGSLSLTDKNNSVGSIVGIRNQAASYILANSNILYSVHNTSLSIGTGNFSVEAWFYTDTLGIAQVIASKRGLSDFFEWQLAVTLSGATNKFVFGIGSGLGVAIGSSVFANSFGAINTSTWYNIVAWHSNNSHIGISVNLSSNTAAWASGSWVSSANFMLGAADTSGSIAQAFGRIDEVGIWSRVLSASDRSTLYGGGSGNTYTSAAGGVGTYSWGMFDFGASSLRWLTVAAGTGLYASSNRGTTFVAIATSRTQNYQYFERSKNVLIATSDSYDPTLFWAGSVGTFAQVLAINSAPNAKYSINYNAFLILLNFTDSNGTLRRRGFKYADENLQLTDDWNDGFDFPSSADDEITAAFVLSKFLYISTRYRIFRVAYVGGNPDWTYLKVKDWGYVPRTVKLVTIKGEQVAVGLDWQRRVRVFDGFGDQIISDSVENDNDYCDFALKKVSYYGSGLIISHAEFDQIEQEYRLNVAIGAQSTQTTHALCLNARTLAMYPYSNQGFQAMCIAESNNQQALMAVDRSGFCHILNSGNLDAYNVPINENYDSPIMYKDNPQIVSKSHEIDFYFGHESSGTVYYQDRVDLSRVYSEQRPFAEFLGTESSLLLIRSIDLKSTHNTYQFRISSSAGTANPWKLTRFDMLQTGLGQGKGVTG